MKRRSTRTPASTSQLDLPFAQAPNASDPTHGPAHDLAFYIGLCTLFAAYHKRWPTLESTREEFRSARVPEYDGQRIERELRFPSVELEADPAYQALREHCLADLGDAVAGANAGEGEGADERIDQRVGIAALDPRYRDILAPDEVAELLDTLTLPAQAGAGTVRYATGLPAHAEDELTLRPGESLRAQALARAGLDPANARVRARAFALRVRATPALRSFLERIGMASLPLPLPAQERLADRYLLAADDRGWLFIQYQVLAGARYAGRFEVEQMIDRLAGVYAASEELTRLGD